MRALLLLLISCLPCFSQVNVQQPMFQSSSGPINLDLLLPNGMAFRWVHTNLTSSPVGTWTDLISNSTMVQGTAGKQPSWTSGDGLYFDGGDWLLMTNVLMSCTTGGNREDCFLFVIKWDATTEQYLLDPDIGAPFVGCNGAAKYYNGSGSMGSVISGIWVDYLYAGGPNDSTAQTFTNGVSMASGNFWPGQGTLGYLGRLDSTETVNYKGWLKEFIIWTNTVNFTTTQVSNIHYYSVEKWSAYDP